MLQKLVKKTQLWWILDVKDEERRKQVFNSLSEAAGAWQWYGRVVTFQIVVVSESEEAGLQATNASQTIQRLLYRVVLPSIKII